MTCQRDVVALGSGGVEMDETKIPPEEWKREGLTIYALRYDGKADHIHMDANLFSAHVSNDNRLASAEEIKAIARLIAAAPELLEALKDCVGGRLGGQPGYVNALALQRAEAAIRKAEGRL